MSRPHVITLEPTDRRPLRWAPKAALARNPRFTVAHRSTLEIAGTTRAFTP
jgi:hypothetical protein